MKVTIFGAGFLGQSLKKLLDEDGVECLLFSENVNTPSTTQINYTQKLNEKNNSFLMSSDLAIISIGSGNMDQVETFPERHRVGHIDKLFSIMNLLNDFQGRVIYISTDNVFTGANSSESFKPQVFSVQEKPVPSTQYGIIKLEAERILQQFKISSTIVRVPLLVSTTKFSRNPLYKFFMDISSNQDNFEVDNSQIRFPTFIEDLKDFLLSCNFSNTVKLIHFSTSEGISRFELFSLMLKELAPNKKVTACKVYPKPISGLKMANRSQVRLKSNVEFNYRSIKNILKTETLTRYFK